MSSLVSVSVALFTAFLAWSVSGSGRVSVWFGLFVWLVGLYAWLVVSMSVFGSLPEF